MIQRAPISPPPRPVAAPKSGSLPPRRHLPSTVSYQSRRRTIAGLTSSPGAGDGFAAAVPVQRQQIQWFYGLRTAFGRFTSVTGHQGVYAVAEILHLTQLSVELRVLFPESLVLVDELVRATGTRLSTQHGCGNGRRVRRDDLFVAGNRRRTRPLLQRWGRGQRDGSYCHSGGGGWCDYFSALDIA